MIQYTNAKLEAWLPNPNKSLLIHSKITPHIRFYGFKRNVTKAQNKNVTAIRVEAQRAAITLYHRQPKTPTIEQAKENIDRLHASSTTPYWCLVSDGAYLALPVCRVPQLYGPVIWTRSQPSSTVDHGIHSIRVVVQRTHETPGFGVPHLRKQYFNVQRSATTTPLMYRL